MTALTLGEVVVVTGPPGAGKTTVAGVLASRAERAVVVDGDAFFSAITQGFILPWDDRSHNQNVTVIKAIGAAVRQYADAGYAVVVDGIVGPWMLTDFLSLLGEAVVSYVVLRPDRETAMSRAVARGKPWLVDPDPIAKMYDGFASLGTYEGHVIDSSELDVESTVDHILERQSTLRLQPGPTEHAVVASGYDLVSRAYADHMGSMAEASRLGWLELLHEHLQPSANVLDLGCGAGVPVTRELARRYRVTGVDISTVQIDRARTLVPEATFLQADLSAVEFAPASFEAIVCLYTLIHVDVALQHGVLSRMHQWLADDALLLITVGETASHGAEQNWLGVAGATMFWSHTEWPTYRRWLEEIGFELLTDATIEDDLDDGDGAGATHHQVLARKLAE